jgi:hypothetical protein
LLGFFELYPNDDLVFTIWTKQKIFLRNFKIIILGVLLITKHYRYYGIRYSKEEIKEPDTTAISYVAFSTVDAFPLIQGQK